MDSGTDQAAKPRWKRIVDFPLIAGFLVLLAVVVPMNAASLALRLVTQGALSDPAYWAIRGTVIPVMVLLIYRWITLRVGEDRSDSAPLNGELLGALRGAALGFAMMTLTVLVVLVLGGYRILGWGGGSSFVQSFFILTIFAAITEEVIVRGIIFRFLEQFAGSWFALAFSSALFGIGHWFNPNATLLTSIAIAIEGGVLLGGAYMLTRNLWLAIGLHAGWNFTQGFIWDVPVSGFATDGLVEAQPAGSVLISGGAFGMEGSVIGFAVASVVGVWLVALAVRRGHIIRPWWLRRRSERA